MASAKRLETWRRVSKGRRERLGADALRQVRVEKARVHPLYYRLIYVAQRARRNGVEFSIAESDLEVVTHCPVLGMELDYEARSQQCNSPSIDRIDNSKGYIPGNVRIISWLANDIKGKATVEQIAKVYDYMRGLL